MPEPVLCLHHNGEFIHDGFLVFACSARNLFQNNLSLGPWEVSWLAVAVVLTLTFIVKSVVTGLAPANLESKNTPVIVREDRIVRGSRVVEIRGFWKG